MGSIAFEKVENSNRDRARFATSLWLWVWVVGLLISRNLREPHKPFAPAKGAERLPDPLKPVPVTTPAKRERGILSLALELVAAIAVRLTQRCFKSWRSRLIENIENTRNAQAARESIPEAAPRRPGRLPDAEAEKSPEKLELEKDYEKGIVALFKNTATEWIQDKCPQLGAALAYFTVFSLAPLVLVLLAVFGLIFGGSDQAGQKITAQLQYFIDPSGIKVIQDIAANAAKPQAGVIATTIGVIIALFGASGVFGQLQEALNTIWGVKPKPGRGIIGFIRTRFLSFAMVGGVCFLLLASLTVETFLRGFNAYLKQVMPGGDIVALAIFLVFDLAVITLLFAMIFRYLPDAKIGWRDVWVGAALTAVLFALGKLVLGFYLGSGAAGSAYGAASSLITLLLWIYYAAQILLFGAEFTQVYANTYGSHVAPMEHALKVEVTEKVVSS